MFYLFFFILNLKAFANKKSVDSMLSSILEVRKILSILLKSRSFKSLSSKVKKQLKIILKNIFTPSFKKIKNILKTV
jgi:hypothetical protein